MSGAVTRTGVTPPSLSFLAIYNPSFGSNDDKLQDQIVYYYSEKDKSRKHREPGVDVLSDPSREESNEKLRQIGLAQGMVEFAKGFSNGDAIDAIETEKSRIILHELEPGWWILASIGLTRISSLSETSSNNGASSTNEPTIEYSAREVSPPALLLQQLLRAHQVFLLHHTPTLARLCTRLTRPKFCRLLKYFWDDYIWNWDLLLNGNPAVDVFNGLKLAAGGELGIGVGEEEWGSGEREVLEGFIGRTDGLVDLIVSRFGNAPQENLPLELDSASTDGASSSNKTPTLELYGPGHHPTPSDGVIFSGIGAVTKSSVKAISSWVEWLYKFGQDAYGIRDNPSAARRRTRRKPSHSNKSAERKPRILLSQELSAPNNATRHGSVSPIGIPAPIVGPMRVPSAVANDTGSSRKDTGLGKGADSHSQTIVDGIPSSAETLMKYLSLGIYGSKWGISPRRSIVNRRAFDIQEKSSSAGSQANANSDFRQEQPKTDGYFLVGLQGELDRDDDVDEEQDTETGTDRDSVHGRQSWSNRTMLRTLQVERAKQKAAGSSSSLASSNRDTIAESHYDRLRVVVYVQQPFIFTFLFELHTDALAMPSFYHSLHYQLGPLQRPLLTSTSPSKVSERLREASAPKTTSPTESSQPICDLVYDPVNLTVHTTIPNIPDPADAATKSSNPGGSWSRVEALNVHSQILNTYSSTRRNTFELERTCKTSRGWWVVWMRLPHDAALQPSQSNPSREAVLIRKASDYVSPAVKHPGGRFGRDISGSRASGGWNAGRLAEGIGIDARQYIEGLLSLNR